MSRTLVTRCGRLAVCAGLVLVAAGCGGAQTREVGTVTGTVTMNGQPLPAGGVESRVAFEHEEGPAEMTNIGPDGKYSLKVTVGRNKVRVEHSEAMIIPTEGRTGLPMPGKNLIPRKYLNTRTSGLEVAVHSGEQGFDIDLKGEADK